MSEQADYYQLKGIVSEMTPEQQAEVQKARDETLIIAARSEVSLIGITLAMLKLAAKA